MIDPSGIKPKNDNLKLKEVKPGVYTIEDVYKGVHEDFTGDVVEPSTVEEQYGSRERSLDDWRVEFGTQERTTVTMEEQPNTPTEEDTTTKFKNQ